MKPTDRNKVCPDCGKKFVAHFAIKRCSKCQSEHRKKSNAKSAIKCRAIKSGKIKVDPKLGKLQRRKTCSDCGKKFIGHFNSHRCKDCQKKAEKQQKENYANSQRGKELTAKRLAKMAEVYNLNKQKKISPKFALTPEEKQKRIEAQKQKAKAKYQELKADPVKWRKAQESKRKWELKNKERLRKERKVWRENNQKQILEYREQYKQSEHGQKVIKVYKEQNHEKLNAQAREYKRQRREYYSALQMKRQAIKLNAILQSTDLSAITKLRKKANRMEEKTGKKYHVDHIIPLSKGGAHHQDNLRIITAKENMAKGSKFDPSLGGVWADNDLAKQTKQKLGIA